MFGQCLAMWPSSWHWKHLSSSFIIMLTIDAGVTVVVSCCTALSFSTSDIASLSISDPFSYMWVSKLCASFKPLRNILIVSASFVQLHLLAAVPNWCIYAARDSFSHRWISINHEVYMWIYALQSFSLSRSFISSHDLFEEITSVTSVHVNPHDFALVSLALFSLVRSAVVLMSRSQSSNLVESCSLKMGIYPPLRSLSGWIVSVKNKRCLCTGVVLPQKVQ